AVRLRREGSVAVQPGQTAARLHRARMHRRIVAASIVIFPLLSGVFFGVITGLAVLSSGGFEHAMVMGALVGGIMLTSNAIALCIVQASAGAEGASRAQVNPPDVAPAK